MQPKYLLDHEEDLCVPVILVLLSLHDESITVPEMASNDFLSVLDTEYKHLYE